MASVERANHRALRCASSQFPRRYAHARDKRRSRPAMCTNQARRQVHCFLGLLHQPAWPVPMRRAHDGSAIDPNAPGFDRVTGSVLLTDRRAPLNVTPEFPSVLPDRELPVLLERAQRGCAETKRVLAKRRSYPIIAGGRGVSLVEDKVDDLQHRSETFSKFSLTRNFKRDSPFAEGSFGSDDALGEGRLRD